MFGCDSDVEFRIRRFGLEIKDREVERFVLILGFQVWSSTAAGRELRHGGGLVPRLE